VARARAAERHGPGAREIRKPPNTITACEGAKRAKDDRVTRSRQEREGIANTSTARRVAKDAMDDSLTPSRQERQERQDSSLCDLRGFA
jgi:hypothetical protein